MLRQVFPPQGEGPEAGQCRQLARVLSMTESMLELAGEGEWDKVALLEQDRRAGLEACFDGGIAHRHAELTAEALAVMLHLNEELMAKLGQAREEVLRRGVEQVRKRSAIGSYEKVKSHSL